MEKFLKNCGLKKAIATFSAHGIKLHQIEKLNERQIERLLPQIGDQVTFYEAVENKKKEERSHESPDEKETNNNNEKKKVSRKRRNEEKEEVNAKRIRILNTDETLAGKLIDEANKIFTNHSLRLPHGERCFAPGWELIDYEQGVINCPFCEVTVTPHIRKNTVNFTWNITNVDRHLNLKHPISEHVTINCDATTTSGVSNTNTASDSKSGLLHLLDQPETLNNSESNGIKLITEDQIAEHAEVRDTIGVVSSPSLVDESNECTATTGNITESKMDKTTAVPVERDPDSPLTPKTAVQIDSEADSKMSEEKLKMVKSNARATIVEGITESPTVVVSSPQSTVFVVESNKELVDESDNFTPTMENPHESQMDKTTAVPVERDPDSVVSSPPPAASVVESNKELVDESNDCMRTMENPYESQMDKTTAVPVERDPDSPLTPKTTVQIDSEAETKLSEEKMKMVKSNARATIVEGVTESATVVVSSPQSTVFVVESNKELVDESDNFLPTMENPHESQMDKTTAVPVERDPDSPDTPEIAGRIDSEAETKLSEEKLKMAKSNVRATIVEGVTESPTVVVSSPQSTVFVVESNKELVDESDNFLPTMENPHESQMNKTTAVPVERDPDSPLTPKTTVQIDSEAETKLSEEKLKMVKSNVRATIVEGVTESPTVVVSSPQSTVFVVESNKELVDESDNFLPTMENPHESQMDKTTAVPVERDPDSPLTPKTTVQIDSEAETKLSEEKLKMVKSNARTTIVDQDTESLAAVVSSPPPAASVVESNDHMPTVENPHELQMDTEPSISQSTSVILVKGDRKPEPPNSPVKDWQMKGVKFGWIKSTPHAKYVPGFILLNGECQWITTKGEVSSKTFIVNEYRENVADSLKKTKLKDLCKFNIKNGTSFV